MAFVNDTANYPKQKLIKRSGNCGANSHESLAGNIDRELI